MLMFPEAPAPAPIQPVNGPVQPVPPNNGECIFKYFLKCSKGAQAGIVGFTQARLNNIKREILHVVDFCHVLCIINSQPEQPIKLDKQS